MTVMPESEAEWQGYHEIGEPEDQCEGSPDGLHCEHWWDGEACHACGAPEMEMEQMIEQGMVEGPVRLPDA